MLRGIGIDTAGAHAGRAAATSSPSPTWRTSARRPRSRPERLRRSRPTPWKASGAGPRSWAAGAASGRRSRGSLRRDSRVTRRRDERRPHRRGRRGRGGGRLGPAALPRDRPRAARAGQGHRHGAVTRPAELAQPHMVFIDNVQGNYFRPESGILTIVGVPCQEWDIDPDTLGTRARRPRRRSSGARAPDPPHPGHGARDAGAGLSRLRLLQPRPPRDPRPCRRRGRPLSRDRVQRLRLQDRACRRDLHGRADPGRRAPRRWTSRHSVCAASPRGNRPKDRTRTPCGEIIPTAIDLSTAGVYFDGTCCARRRPSRGRSASRRAARGLGPQARGEQYERTPQAEARLPGGAECSSAS